jgi:hypothetical protein
MTGRLLARVAAALLLATLALGLAAPAVLAADPLDEHSRIVIANERDVVVAQGDALDLLVLSRGDATIEGSVANLIVIEGSATLRGASVESIVAVRSPIELEPDTVVGGRILTLDALVHLQGNAQVVGGTHDLVQVAAGLAPVLAPALLLILLGIALSSIVAAVLLAAFVPRQLREAEGLISSEPGTTFLAGFAAIVALPFLVVALMVSLIGAPLAFGLVLTVAPLLAFAGYLVSAVWIGEWLLRRLTSRPAGDRPYGAAIVGVVSLQVVSIIPVLTLAVPIASLFGLGAILRLAYRAFRAPVLPLAPAPVLPQPTAI